MPLYIRVLIPQVRKEGLVRRGYRLCCSPAYATYATSYAAYAILYAGAHGLVRGGVIRAVQRQASPAYATYATSYAAHANMYMWQVRKDFLEEVSFALSNGMPLHWPSDEECVKKAATSRQRLAG